MLGCVLGMMIFGDFLSCVLEENSITSSVIFVFSVVPCFINPSIRVISEIRGREVFLYLDENASTPSLEGCGRLTTHEKKLCLWAINSLRRFEFSWGLCQRVWLLLDGGFRWLTLL